MGWHLGWVFFFAGLLPGSAEPHQLAAGVLLEVGWLSAKVTGAPRPQVSNPPANYLGLPHMAAEMKPQ